MTSLRAWRAGGVIISLSGDVMATRRRLRRRTRAARVGPREAPRFGGQPSFDLIVWVAFWEMGGGEDAACSGESMECREDGAPDIYSSLKALLCSGNFHSLRKPRVPILNESIGGTEGTVAKREEARRIVPSPPNVAVKSTFWVRKEDRRKPFESVVVLSGIV